MTSCNNILLRLDAFSVIPLSRSAIIPTLKEQKLSQDISFPSIHERIEWGLLPILAPSTLEKDSEEIF